MTTQEAFKKRVRARMATTGERYAAARRVLLERAAASDRRRVWVSEPEMGDAAIRRGTGRGWDEWCDLVEAWPGHVDGHPAVAAWVHAEHGLDHWWAQGVTIGWERITGRRLPGQMPDGTFTANKSATVAVDAVELRAALLDDDARSELFPGLATALRSRPASKTVRLSVGPGVAGFTLEPRPDGRTKVTVSHERLPAYDLVEEWKFWWSDWLAALDGPSAA